MLKEEIKEYRKVKTNLELLKARIELFANQLEKTLIYTNAKVYDVSSYIWKEAKEDFPILTEEEIDSEFGFFCEHEWNYFDTEYLHDNCYKDHICRTSTFRIISKSLSELETDNSYYGSYKEQLLDLINNECYPDFKDFFEEYKDEYELDEMVSNWCEEVDIAIDNVNYQLDNMVEEFKDVKKAYDYLKTFQKNQVEIFKNYLEHICEDIEIYEPERRLDVLNFHAQQEIKQVKKSITINIQNTLYKKFLEEHNEKELTNDYETLEKIVEFIEREDRKEFYQYSKDETKTNQY